MMNLTAIKENPSACRPGVEEQHRVVQKSGKKGGFEISERQPVTHSSLISAVVHLPWRGRLEAGRSGPLEGAGREAAVMISSPLIKI
jgi:hypothetical protein